MATNVEMKIRIHAEHLRKCLLSRNSGLVFREILASLSDEGLVRKYEEHHARQVAFAREQNANG
jgi:hypothetical protein